MRRLEQHAERTGRLRTDLVRAAVDDFLAGWAVGSEFRRGVAYGIRLALTQAVHLAEGLAERKLPTLERRLSVDVVRRARGNARTRAAQDHRTTLRGSRGFGHHRRRQGQE